jgi:hypothetical protein
MCGWALLWAAPVHAQLASSFYNVTAIEKRVLPNAVQIVIRTDGTVVFGGDQNDWVNNDENRYEPKRVNSIRVRLLRARANLPAFVDLGTYPVEGALITPGREGFASPIFPWASYNPPDPQLDIEVQFYVPILIRRFVVDRSGGNSSENVNENAVNFGSYLAPLEASVELGNDRRSIVITVITDRADTGGEARSKRVKPEEQKHRLNITPLAPSPLGAQSTLGLETPLRVDVLHAPLSEVLSQVTLQSGVPLGVREQMANLDISLLLPQTTVGELLRTLETGYGLFVAPRPATEGGGFLLGRGGPSTVTERLPLKYLAPDRARLLFPDFLLPLMRVDPERNALIVSGQPVLVERIRRDLSRLDNPRAQVRVEAQVYEIADTKDYNLALQVAYSGRDAHIGFDTNISQVTLNVQDNQSRALQSTINALASKGRARLRARPFSVVASGAEGSLFLGQTRYVVVLRTRSGRQEAQAVQLQIGYSLSVTPIVGATGEILMSISPRASTVDEVENGTGLPTLGIREVSSTVRIRDSDTIIVAGLDADIDEGQRRKWLVSKRKNASQTHLLVLVTARRV